MKTFAFLRFAGDRALNFARLLKLGCSKRDQRLDRIRTAAWRCVDVLESRTLLSSVSGTVYSDLVLSGSRSTGDPGLAGITVYDDLNNSGQFQTGDPSDVTASDGSFKMYHVPLNSAQVIRAAAPSGWEESTAGGGASTVNLVSGATHATGINFGLWQPISGLDCADLSLTEGQNYTGSVVNVLESADTYANPNWYTASLVLNGTNSVNFGFDDDGNLLGTPGTFPPLAAGTYTATVDVAESNDGQTFNSSSDFTVTVTAAPISAQGVSLTATAGTQWSGTIATFTDGNPVAHASDYVATIDYGDSSELSVGTVSPDGSGGFVVTDCHVFPTDGNFSPAVTITDPADTNKQGTASSTASVSLASISASAPDLQMQEGQTYSGGIATLTDAAGSYATGNYSASLTIDGAAYGGVTFSSLGSGVYSIQASDIPMLSVGTHSGVLNVSETGVTSSTSASPADFSIDVADAPLTGAPANISAYAGVPYTGAVATFTDADPTATAGDYSATISYSDGTTAGTISSDGSGGWIVSSTLNFSTIGTSSPVVTITDVDGSSAVVTSSAAVSLAGLSLSASQLYLEQGDSYSGDVGLLTDAAGSYSNASNFSGSLTWDGWIYGNLSFTSAGDGMWNVVSSGLAPLPAGNYSATLSITETIGAASTTTDPVSFNIAVISPTLYGSGVYISATVGQAWSGTIANIGDDDSYDLPSSYYTASTNYNDGTSASAGQISTNSNSGSWAVTDAHTFGAAGDMSPQTTVSDLNNNVVATATSSASVNLAQISLNTSSVWLTEGQSLGSEAGTLTDAAGSYATGSYTGSLTLTPSGASSQTYSVSFVPDGLSDGGYSVQASGVPALSAGTYSALLAASESSGNGQTVYASSTFVISVADAPLDTAGASISAQLGSSWTGTVATFTDPDPNATVSDYAATVSFGDGSDSVAGTIAADGIGGWVVTASHTFTAVGTLAPVVTISDLDGGTSYAAYGSATVSPAPIDLSASDVQVEEGQSIPTSLGTLTDTGGQDDASSYGGSLTVDGNTYTLSATPDGQSDGGYILSGSDLPVLAVGSHSATLSAVEYIAGQSVEATPVTFSIDVADVAPTGQGQDLSLTANVPFTGTLATFSDADSYMQASNYSATINDGNGNSSAGAVSSDGNGGFIVTGTLSYSTIGNYSPTVTITDDGGSTLALSGLAAVNFAPLSLSASTIHLPQGQTYTGVVGILIDSAGSNSNSSYYSATLTWADGSTDTDLSFAPDGVGQWQIVATALPAVSEGAYSASLSVTESVGGQSVSTDPADFSVYAASVSGVYINATVGSPWYGTIATVNDPDSSDQPSDFTASTDYGDSTSPSTGSISQGYGDWIVTDTHTFTAAGNYSPAISVSNTSTSVLLASSTGSATANLAPISLTTATLSPAEGQSIDGIIGTLTDTAGTYATGNYTGSITLDGDTYSVTFVPDGSNDGGYSVDVSGTPNLSAGTHSATLNVSEFDSTLDESVSAVAPFTIYVASTPPSLASDSPTSLSATEGQSFTGTLLHFTDADPSAGASSYSATVNWGDGNTDSTTDSSSPISIVADSAGGFDVVGTHTYETGAFTATVSVQDSYGNSVSSAPAFAVADAPLTQVNDVSTTVSGVESQTLTTTVLHFTDADPNAVAGQYTASVNWGDGTTSNTSDSTPAVSVAVDSNGGFDVIGSHSYASAGSFTISVQVWDNGSSTLAVTASTAAIADAPLTLASDSPSSFGGVESQTFSGTVLHFTDGDPSAVAGQYTASVDWGDGSSSTTSSGVSVTTDGSGGFNVTASHAFAASGTYTVAVSVSDSGGSTVSNTLTATITPAAPTGLSATAVSSSEIDLSWSNNANSYTSVEILRATSADGSFSSLGTVASGTTTYQDTSLSPGTTYYYEVRALNSGLSSDFSNVASDTTQT